LYCTPEKIDGVAVVNHVDAQQVRPFVLKAIQIAREISDQRFPSEFSIQGTGVLSVEHILEQFSYIKGTLGPQRYGDHFRYDPGTAADIGCDYTSLAVLRQYEQLRNDSAHPEDRATRFRYVGDATYDMALHLLSDDPIWGWDTHPLDLSLEGIVLDEMHDCSWAMFTVLRHLLELNPNASFLGIGDRDQVIHGKHGADTYFMGPDLDREIGVVSRFPLTLTHRFGKQLARPLALHAQKDYQSSTAAETQVSLHLAEHAKDNVGLILELFGRYKSVAGSVEEDFAILLRHTGASVELEHSLLLKGVGYQTVGFKPFLQRPEIAFVRMLLSIAVDHQTVFMPESLLEAKLAVWQYFGANLPTPNSKEETKNTVESATEPNFKSFVFHALLGEAEKQLITSVHDALEIGASNDTQSVTQFVRALNFLAMAQKILVSKRDIKEAESSLENFAEVAKHYESIDGLLGALNMMDRQQRKVSASGHQFRLSTIEGAKGLEFRHIFIPDCNVRVFDGTSQDEKNLFYVAASRARESLAISYRKGSESTFLRHFRQ
jgi:DNA helicase II / ATP-dependent DNA helicase PcrA